MTNKNEIVIAAGQELGNDLIPNLFGDIDFNGLNNAIENMAEASGELDKEEKELACSIIDDWNESVVERLRRKEHEMNGLISFFDPKSPHTYIAGMDIEEFGPVLAEKTNTAELYEKYQASTKSLEDLRKEEPERPIKSESTSFEEDIKAQKEYEAKYSIYSLKRARLERERNKAIGEWKLAMNETETVKELIKSARKFTRGVNGMYQQAQDKSQLAKLNISISSSSARESLKELLTFTTKL